MPNIHTTCARCERVRQGEHDTSVRAGRRRGTAARPRPANRPRREKPIPPERAFPFQRFSFLSRYFNEFLFSPKARPTAVVGRRPDYLHL